MHHKVIGVIAISVCIVGALGFFNYNKKDVVAVPTATTETDATATLN